MRKRITLFGMLITAMMGLTCVNAAECSNSEKVRLDSLAAKVKTTYELAQMETDIPSLPSEADPEASENIKIDVFKVGIINVTDELYVEVTEKNDKSQIKRYTSSDALEDEIIYFYSENAYEAKEYTMKIYANTSACKGTLLQSRTISLPVYNQFADLPVCTEQYPEFAYCQKFLNAEVSYTQFSSELENYKNKTEEQEQIKEQEKSFLEKVKDYYKEHKIIIFSAAGTIIIVGVATAAIVIKKRRSRLL